MRKGGLEPPRGFPHYHLKVARIPIPPLSLFGEKKHPSILQQYLQQVKLAYFHLFYPPVERAAMGDRNNENNL